ncbi:PREDICTED: pentatricopeptide repeat-containing protein At2g20710, mitochondrial-like [Camelina sativa]|uniref:Pentatricopeptide repeat-containing protein At2g20710, mitochondrial-like n=1 Tax=Camelina sativa TaxID=90675 RepID=A0ABM0UD69_CAMSA|nr:PREDICTED: pentatricopeptide repeat-containing protein At2g20710, mitochondrial-like [Camelina sativa]
MWFCNKLNNGVNLLLGIQRRTLSRGYGSSSMGKFDLYKRISPLGDPKISIVPVLDEWRGEGNYTSKEELRGMIKELMKYKRFGHALEVSRWMSDRMFFPLSTADFGTRINLISRVSGLGEAEVFFDNIPKNVKGIAVFSSLLSCYARAKSAEKAERLVASMKETGISMDTRCYNLLMNMYYQMNVHGKLDDLMFEMQQNGVPFDQFTLGIRLSAYAAASNIEGIEKTIEKISSMPHMAIDWTIYSAAANAFLKVELMDKATMMLKKCEELVNEDTGNEAFHTLLKLYGEAGQKDDLCRVWLGFKEKRKVFNIGYRTMISSALKLGDIELAEKVFNQWESKKLAYDFRIPNLLIKCYCEKGLIEKAELLLKKLEGNGVDPPMDVYLCLANSYLETDEISKATEAIERAVSLQPETKHRLEAQRELLNSCLACLKGNGDGRKRFGDVIDSLTSENLFSVAALETLSHHFSEIKGNK